MEKKHPDSNRRSTDEKIINMLEFWVDIIFIVLKVDGIQISHSYPTEFETKDTIESWSSAVYSDLLLSIGSDGHFRNCVDDKRYDFNFHAKTLSFRSWIATSYNFLRLWRFHLTAHTMCQDLLRERFKSSLWKFCRRYGNLIR